MVAIAAEFETPTERLEAEVCTLAAQLAAATCRFVLLIAELDRRAAWNEWGCRSMAHWLTYRCALSLATAREQVRVGRALAELPHIREKFAAGVLSYSKVRALVRIATPEAEAQLVELAEVATASQLEQVVGASVRASRTAAESQFARRGLRWRDEDDGGATLIVRVTADQKVVLRAALECAEAEVPTDDASADACDNPVVARRADALEVIARAFVDGAGSAAPRTDVALHADLATLIDEEHGEVLRMLACDARLTLHVEDRGKTLDVGRRTRSIPAPLRRAIERRDRGCCRFPGCGNRRFLHVHHIEHYAHGGPTRAPNLVMLCTFRHRLVHVAGWALRGRADGELIFAGPDGRLVTERVPSRSAAALRSGNIDHTTITTAEGGRLDLDHAVTAAMCLLRRAHT